MNLLLRIPVVSLLVLASFSIRAASLLPETTAQKAKAADACVIADVVFQHSEPIEGNVHTRFVFRTHEALKGQAPDYFEAHTPGGEWGDFMHDDSRRAKLASGQRYLLFLEVDGEVLRIRDGFAGAIPNDEVFLQDIQAIRANAQGGADLSDFAEEPISVSASVTADGLLNSGNGPFRYILADQGRAIPVIADVSTLPSGITSEQALTALQNALNAWEAVCSIRFNLQGTETFTQSADDYSSSDGMVIRVQMHDNFNKISNASSTLGFGGSSFSVNLGGGGTVNGKAFNRANYGYVVLDHPKSTLEDPVALEEVLTHEIGHVIGLAHSSETFPESDANLREAIMYFQAQDDGRGADVRSYDTTTILQSYAVNLPPYSFDQKIRVTTYDLSETLQNPEVNQVVMEGFDQNGDALSFVVDSSSSGAGSFSQNGNTITFTPANEYADSIVQDPNTQSFGILEGHFTDGVNKSATIEVWIIALLRDTRPSGAPDGIPDSWNNTHYGNITGPGDTADTDLDGYNTLQEYRIDSDPTDANSNLSITGFTPGAIQWVGRRFDLYRIQTRSDLTTGDWTTIRLDSESENLSTFTSDELPEAAGGEALFYRIERVE